MFFLRDYSYVILEKFALLVVKSTALLFMVKFGGLKLQGQFTLLLTYWSLASGFSLLGNDQVAQQQVARDGESRKFYLHIVSNLICQSVVFGLVVGVILAAVLRALGEYSDVMCVIIALFSIVQCLWLSFGFVAKGSFLFKQHMISIISQYVIFLISFIAVLQSPLELSILTVTICWFLATVLSMLYIVYCLPSFSIREIRFYPYIFKQSLSKGVKMFTHHLTSLLNFRIIYIILRIFESSVVVGLFSLIVAFAEILLYLPRGISTVVFSKLSFNKNIDLSKTLQYTFILLCVSAAIVTAIAPILIVKIVEGIKLGELLPIMTLTIGSSIPMGMCVLIVSALFAVSDSWAINRASATCLIVIGLMGPVCVNMLGLLGAAITMFVSYSIFFILMLRLLESVREDSIKSMFRISLSELWVEVYEVRKKFLG